MRRSNPWPAFVDLFSALLIPAFGGLLLLSAAYKQRVDTEVVVSELRKVTDEIHKELRLAISEQQGLRSRVRECGDDTCIDLYIHFQPSQDGITRADEKDALHKLAIDLRTGLDRLKENYRRQVEVIVEGHADRQQIRTTDNPRYDYLYNWNLSARRASSVVYEFRTQALTVENYRIVATGYADSEPVPECKGIVSKECDDLNRRTTLRLRVDTKSVATLLVEQKKQN